jgi:hypothetical protein
MPILEFARDNSQPERAELTIASHLEVEHKGCSLGVNVRKDPKWGKE